MNLLNSESQVATVGGAQSLSETHREELSSGVRGFGLSPHGVRSGDGAAEASVFPGL